MSIGNSHKGETIDVNKQIHQTDPVNRVSPSPCFNVFLLEERIRIRMKKIHATTNNTTTVVTLIWIMEATSTGSRRSVLSVLTDTSFITFCNSSFNCDSNSLRFLTM